MDCVFSQCCEQVISGAGEGRGVFVHRMGKEKKSVYALGRRTHCWVLAGSSVNSPLVIAGKDTYKRCHGLGHTWPLPGCPCLSPDPSQRGGDVLSPRQKHPQLQRRCLPALGEGGVRSVVCPCLPRSVSCCWSFKSNACRWGLNLLFCGRWGCSAWRSEVEMAAISFHPATTSKVQTFGGKEFFSEQHSSLPGKSSCFE